MNSINTITLKPNNIVTSCQWIDFLFEESEITMNRDRSLFLKIKNESSLPILRFYRWKFPTLSYGRTKKIGAKELERYRQEGWNCVERPTGGGKVFHKNDLCFSLFWRKENHFIPWAILDSYKLIHEWVQKSMEQIGIKSVMQENKKDDLKNLWCFRNPVSYDLMRNQNKIVGGAQWRDGNAALHQGSIQLNLKDSALPIFKFNFESFFNTKFSAKE